MAQTCTYARNTSGGLVGEIVFNKISTLQFTSNNSAPVTQAITLNNAAFTNNTQPGFLTRTFFGYKVPFTVQNFPQGTQLQVTAGENANAPTVLCVPDIECNFYFNDSLGTSVTGNSYQSGPYLPITFQPNNNSTAGLPYKIKYGDITLINGKNAGVRENVFQFTTSGYTIQTLYINNFLCTQKKKVVSDNDDSKRTFRGEPWFWDLIVTLILVMFWIWFYLYTLKPRGQGFHFTFNFGKGKKNVITSSSSQQITEVQVINPNSNLTSSVD